MKKIIASVLIIIMLFFCCSCGKKQNVSPVDELTVQKTLDCWQQYLQTNEVLNCSVVWAMDYIIDYCDNPGLITYRRALAAAESAYATLSQLKAEKCSLDSSDFEALSACGEDLSFITAEIEAVTESIRSNGLIVGDILNSLLMDAFWNYGIDYIRQQAQYRKQAAQQNITYLQLESNYLCLSLGYDDYPKSFTENCEALFGDDVTFSEDIESVEDEIFKCLDEIDKQYYEGGKIESLLEDNQRIFDKAAESGDWSEVLSERTVWQDDCVTLPLPTFDFPSLVSSYRFDENSGEMIYTVPGNDLTDVPEGFTMAYSEVSEQVAREYISKIVDEENESFSVSGSIDGGDYSCTYVNGPVSFSVSYRESKLILLINDKMSCFCPQFYSQKQ